MQNTQGTSLAEVMTMMVILSIALVGIFSMVTSGRRLATLSDTRLAAVNIAREGLESVTTLRDSYHLAGFSTEECLNPLYPEDVFFSTDRTSIGTTNCPEVRTTPQEPYYQLQDDKTLIVHTGDAPVCINEFGWNSQQYFDKTNSDACIMTTTSCGDNTISKCRTKFQRRIFFENCDPINTAECLIITSQVWWGDDPTDINTSLTLSQTITTYEIP